MKKADIDATAVTNPASDWGVFSLDQLDELRTFFVDHGFAVLRGLWSEDAIKNLEVECSTAQQAVADSKLADRHGNRTGHDLTDGSQPALPSHVLHVTEVSKAVNDAVHDDTVTDLIKGWLGDCWLMSGGLFGVVFQDSRPGAGSSYTRIGWHSDWQSAPHLDRWPSVAFTIHIDETSPANGFLRIVPGSHKWATPAPFKNANNIPLPENAKPTGGHTDQPAPFEMPLTFDYVPGEVGVYCERGDLLFHDAYVWHSAARGTDDETMRRHIRGAWYSGLEDQVDTPDRFIKNAAR